MFARACDRARNSCNVIPLVDIHRLRLHLRPPSCLLLLSLFLSSTLSPFFSCSLSFSASSKWPFASKSSQRGPRPFCSPCAVMRTVTESADQIYRGLIDHPADFRSPLVSDQRQHFLLCRKSRKSKSNARAPRFMARTLRHNPR